MKLERGTYASNLAELKRAFPEKFTRHGGLPTDEYLYDLILDQDKKWWVCFAWPAHSRIRGRISYVTGSFIGLHESASDAYAGERRPGGDSLLIGKNGEPSLDSVKWQKVEPDKTTQNE